MIQISRKGGHVCIVDQGRYGFRRYGVPISGAMDKRSAARANSLLHNPLNSAVLELYMPGHQLDFFCSTVVALTGAEGEIELNGKRIYTDHIYEVPDPSSLTIGALTKGSRIYMAFPGGINSTVLMNSRSPIPSFFERNLSKGDTFEIRKIQDFQKGSGTVSALKIESGISIKCTPGPEWHLLSTSIQRKLAAIEYTLDSQSNRMGFRLTGEEIKADSVTIFSSGVMPGTVQLLPSGLPLILSRDCQTTGGYPRVLQIIEEDLNQLAQRKPGDSIKFEVIEI